MKTDFDTKLDHWISAVLFVLLMLAAINAHSQTIVTDVIPSDAVSVFNPNGDAGHRSELVTDTLNSVPVWDGHRVYFSFPAAPRDQALVFDQRTYFVSVFVCVATYDPDVANVAPALHWIGAEWNVERLEAGISSPRDLSAHEPVTFVQYDEPGLGCEGNIAPYFIRYDVTPVTTRETRNAFALDFTGSAFAVIDVPGAERARPWLSVVYDNAVVKEHAPSSFGAVKALYR